MGLNRMMMKNGVKVEDGSKYWTGSDADNKPISFTVPSGIKRIKVTSLIDKDKYEEEPDIFINTSITNTFTHKVWGKGRFKTDHHGEVVDETDIDSIVGVTPNKTYTLHFDCYYTSGVTFSWGKAINDMTPTVEDY